MINFINEWPEWWWTTLYISIFFNALLAPLAWTELDNIIDIYYGNNSL